MSTYKNRFPNTTSRIHIDLILAEEKYLEALGWEMQSYEDKYSTWKHPKYTNEYSRQQALLVAKSQDENFGLY